MSGIGIGGPAPGHPGHHHRGAWAWRSLFSLARSFLLSLSLSNSLIHLFNLSPSLSPSQFLTLPRSLYLALSLTLNLSLSFSLILSLSL